MNLSKSTIEIIGLLLACGLWLTSAASAQTTTWTAMRRSVVVSIPDRELAVIENGKVIRTFRVAVGAPVSPSPTGEFRVVSLVDRLVDGLSSVDTFFDPEPQSASYGTYSILWQIERCIELGLPYLYLGYWIRESPKMAYKATFRPIEGLVGGRWTVL